MKLATLLPFGPETPLDAFRYPGKPGHVESYFVRAVDPKARRALWLKLTVFAPLDGPAVVETWFIWFDGEKNLTRAHRGTHPFAAAALHPEPGRFRAEVGSCDFTFASPGGAKGKVEAGGAPLEFALRWSSGSGPWAAPLILYPTRTLREGPLPRFKFVTPLPCLRLSGTVKLPDETVDVTGWAGSLGHNWGVEHPLEYGWGQCLFPQGADGPDTYVEAGAGRILIGGRALPSLGIMVVRRGDQVYRFNHLRDLTHHEATATRTRWTLRIWGPEGEARLRLDATDRPMVCLGYPNPTGRTSYCFNSKLAEVLLEVRPRRGQAFTAKSPHGGALELLRPLPAPEMPVV